MEFQSLSEDMPRFHTIKCSKAEHCPYRHAYKTPRIFLWAISILVNNVDWKNCKEAFKGYLYEYCEKSGQYCRFDPLKKLTSSQINKSAVSWLNSYVTFVKPESSQKTQIFRIGRKNTIKLSIKCWYAEYSRSSSATKPILGNNT